MKNDNIEKTQDIMGKVALGIKAPEVVVNQLIKLIRSNKLVPGDKLPSERELCKITEVSRPCLREALRALQVMGIIDMRHGSGAFIKQVEPKAILDYLDIAFMMDELMYDDLFVARKVLEMAAARMAAQFITDAQLLEIEQKINMSVGEVENAKVFMRLDCDIHNMIVHASGNRILQAFVQSLTKPNLYAREITIQDEDSRRQTLLDHKRILKSLKARDPEKAADSIKVHLDNVERTFNKMKTNRIIGFSRDA